ncbi:MAG: hypothetical protein IK006_04815 [Bacteroidaceae bacterium]|nr:hypothetical protein [Bacteroidaceae bacterium]
MKKALFLMLALLLSTDCENSYSTMSVKYRVRFTCRTDTAPFNQISTPGRFLTVRMLPDGNLSILDPDGKETTRPLTQKESSSFALGLSGLIIGKPLFETDPTSVSAFDLACPECDQQRYRLTIDLSGNAKCAKCGNTWNLNNGGFPVETASGKVRTLYRYPVKTATNSITVSN